MYYNAALGLIMVGAMTASNVSFSSILTMEVEGSEPVLIQTYLDSIFIGLVPLGLTLFCLWLLKRNVNVNYILAGVLVLAIVLGLIGVV